MVLCIVGRRFTQRPAEKTEVQGSSSLDLAPRLVTDIFGDKSEMDFLSENGVRVRSGIAPLMAGVVR